MDIDKSTWELCVLLGRVNQGATTLTKDQWLVLMAIKELGQEVSQKDIACKLDKDQANTKRMVEQLEEKGFLKRKVDTKDRRAFKISLTINGEEALDQGGKRQTERFRGALTGCSPSMVKSAISTLEKIDSNIQQLIEQEKKKPF